MNVLLSAFACGPGSGSEPGIGWGVLREVAARHDTWVITLPSRRAAIERALERHPLPRARFLYVPPAPATEAALGRGVLGYPAYLAWQRTAAREARRLHRAVGLDLVHHVTYGMSWMPTYMATLEIPFVWTAGIRDGFDDLLLDDVSPAGRRLERRRNAAIRALRPLAERHGKRADAILSTTEARAWPDGFNVRLFVTGGLEVAELDALAAIPPRASGPFRIASIGRLLGWKGIGLALEAFARLVASVPDATYVIVGDGPERRMLEARAHALGCADAVRFTGWLSRDDALAALADVDALIHPSVHDHFGYVVAEAMAAGKPVVCLDRGGPPEVVGKDGIVISTSTRAAAIDDLASAMVDLADDRDGRVALGQRARERARRMWSWPAVGERLCAVYAEVAR